MRAFRLGSALVLTLAVQTSLAHVAMGNRAVMDLVLVLVVFVGLRHGATAGLFFGTLAGLCQDVLSGGLLGVGGLSKSLVGATVGVLAVQFILTSPIPRLVIFLAASVLHAVCFLGIYALIEPSRVGVPWPVILLQALLNAGIGLIVFEGVEQLPDAWHRRRLRRARLTPRRET